MTSDTYVFLAGASRGVGEQIAFQLMENHIKTKVLLRSETTKTQLESMGCKVAMGDALEVPAVEAALLGEEPIDMVISTIGGLPQEGQRADYLGNKNLIDTAVKAGAKKFILISSIGSGNSKEALPPRALEALGEVLIEKEKAEEYLINSGLTYIIIRPGGLKSEPATGNGILTENPKISGIIHRADVAHLVMRCLQSDAANNKVLSALDRNMIAGNLSEDEVFKFTNG
jgi:nucleoside-diphosphate-sugar epimerase